MRVAKDPNPHTIPSILTRQIGREGACPRVIVIFADLSTLGSSVNSDDFNFDHIKPRLNVALADDLDDVLVWDQVYNAVTPVSAPDSIFPPPPLYSIDHRTHTIVQLPLEKDADVS
ncbi:hypothetical protein ACJZ2D_016865 [Fusarium nematophilum]